MTVRIIINPNSYTFIQFDICDFYSSISKKLLSDAIEWAESMTTIGREKREIIFHVRKSFLFDRKQPWVKTKDGNFDIPMVFFQYFFFPQLEFTIYKNHIW